MKTRPFLINYHHPEYSPLKINRCWGNSVEAFVTAYNVIDAIKRFYKKRGTDKKIYSIEAYHPTVQLDYDATQQLLKMENLLYLTPSEKSVD